MSVDEHPARVAVILAAGRGERLRPYDGTRPKPLIDLLGVSLAERVGSRPAGGSPDREGRCLAGL